MKNLYLLLFIPFLANAQIPNSGFENWSMHNGILEPDGWETNNEILFGDTLKFVERIDSIFSEGDYSLFIRPLQGGSSVVASGIASTKIAPPNAADTLIVSIMRPKVYDFRSGVSVYIEDINTGEIFSDGIKDSVITSFSEWKLPFNFTSKPDTVKITIAIGSYGMSAYPDGAYIDDINFQSTISQPEYLYDNLQVYPNPVKDILEIQTEQEITQTNITDLHGKTLYYNETFQEKISLDDFTKGIYILHLTGPAINICKKIIKE